MVATCDEKRYACRFFLDGIPSLFVWLAEISVFCLACLSPAVVPERRSNSGSLP